VGKVESAREVPKVKKEISRIEELILQAEKMAHAQSIGQCLDELLGMDTTSDSNND